jgi:hypothetical protein
MARYSEMKKVEMKCGAGREVSRVPLHEDCINVI